jgi:hypothetical protein
MRPSPYSPLGHLAVIGPDEGDAVGGKRGAVAARGRVLSHMRGFMAGATSTALVGGQQRRGGEVVGEAVRHLRHQVGGGRRHDDQVGLARQLGYGRHRARPERSNRSVKTRSAESAPTDSGVTNCSAARRHDAAHAERRARAAADQVEALVGRDAAADDEQDALAGECHSRVSSASGNAAASL